MVGAQASELFGDAKAILERVVAERWLKAKAVVGFWPATRIGDDIEIQHQGEAIRLHHLRQQADKPVERPNLCLADFIAPRESGVTDWIRFCSDRRALASNRIWSASARTTTTTRPSS